MPTTERTVVTRLVANNDAYDRAMRRSAGETRNLAQAGGVASKQVGQTSSMLRASSEDLRTVGTTAGIAGLALAAGIGYAVKTAMDFDKEMSNLAAVSGATGEEMGVLRDAVLEAGKASVFSASEAAKAASELAKAGISTSDILGGGLTGALNLAAAGNLDLATAAELSANAMTTFKLSGSDVPRIADALAAGANKSAAEVADMGQALSQAGLVADQTGLSLEDTVGTLALFAQAGLKGSDAGTSLRTMLLRLNPSSVEAADAMHNLGLEFYDAEGSFVGISGASELLRTKLAGLTQEQKNQTLQTIFGQDAIRAATILMESGASGVDEWTQAVSDSGYAAEVANQKTDNLAGDLERLKGAIETALIENGSAATGALRGIAGGAEQMIEGFSALPGPLQATGGGILGISTAGLLAVGAFGTLIPKFREVKSVLEGMGSLGQMVGRNMGTIAAGAGIATVALAGITYVWGEHAQAAAEAAAKADRFTEALKQLAETGEDTRDKIIAEELANSKAAGALEKHADAVGAVNRAIIDGQDGLSNMISLYAASDGRVKQWADSMRNGAQAGDEFVQAVIAMIDAGDLDSSGLLDLLTKTKELNNAHGTGSDAARRQKVFEGELSEANRDGAAAAGEHAGAQGDLGVKFDETTGKIEEQKTELETYRDRLKELFDPYFALMNAQDRLKGAQDDLTAAQLEYLAAVKDHGAKSIEAAAALDKLNDAQRGVWEAAVDSESALADLANQVSTGKITYEEAATKVDGMATSLGWSKEQADQMKLALFFATLQAQEFDGDYQARLAIDGYDNVYSKLTVLIALGKTFAEAWRIAVPQAPEGVKPNYGVPGSAGGGMLPEGLSVVGERGMEAVMKHGSNVEVIPNSDTRRMFSNDWAWGDRSYTGGSTSYDNRTFNVTVAIPKGTDVNNPKRLARQLAPDLVREMARLEGSTS